MKHGMRPRLLMIDNYDSFTYNLVQYFGELHTEILVYRNDQISLAKIAKMSPAYIVISPGPCDPARAGISCDVIRRFYSTIPILGVCLGHQCLSYAFGGKIVHARQLMHGKTSLIYHDQKTIFKRVANPFEATRYHSLVAQRRSLPKCFEVIARTKDKEIMAIKHRDLPVWGVQFHPESILTREGKKILKNFLDEGKKQ